MAVIALTGVMLAACASDASATPSPTGPPPVTSFDEYKVEFCSAWHFLYRAVGDPNNGLGSPLNDALDAAVEGRDGLAAARLAGEVDSALVSGRQAAAAASGWKPAAPTMAAMDRLFVALQAMTAAKVAVAAGVPNAVDPKVALEQAGGQEAFKATVLAYEAMTLARPADQTSDRCANVPIAP